MSTMEQLSRTRFTVSVRASGRVSSSLTPYQEPEALVDAIRRKRESKKAVIRSREKTVADLIKEVSSECTKQQRLKVW